MSEPNKESLIESIISYLWIASTITIAWIFFTILNRTVVYGRENVPLKKNLLLLPNHQTMIDSFVVGTKLFYPRTLLKPSLIPYHPAAQENFFKNPVLAWMSKNWRAIPVKRGRKDIELMNKIIKMLPNCTMINFPEGTRSRTGKIGKGRSGVGKIIYDAKPTVIPVRIVGMNKVLPIGSYIPRIFKKIEVYYGKPIDFSDLYELPDNKETWLKIVDRVMEHIKALAPDDSENQEFSN
ncbi:MAG: 1-acyl-sn-glycerol-3-phosphate acyltransferase [Candidatus Schekmanbacteria bacterium]|nr:MAG: 1-acyl-sn-glycerol-3-phosphate acyltransferase [Candidatus Schekmanbacteria bacterium]